MNLVEQHIIKKNNSLYKELDQLCFLSKNLYNTALYTIRQNYFKEHTFINFYAINKLFTQTNNIDYYNLPSKVSQWVLKQVDQNFKSFFGSLNAKRKNKIKSNIKIPHYLNKEGRFLLTYTEQAISKTALKDGYIQLSKSNIRIKTNIKNVNQVRIIPHNEYITIEVVYTKNVKDISLKEKSYMGIDIGINNLMSCSFSDLSLKPVLCNGRPLKAINHFYNKQLGYFKSKLSKIVDENKVNQCTSHRIKSINRIRNCKINDYLHKITRILTNYIVSNDITDIFIGYNKEWKQGVNLGVKNNQKFVQIPFLKLIDMLTYKCNLEGIKVNKIEESYTSKCSFLDEESIEKHDVYKGSRITTKLFRSLNGRILNADINAAYNILKNAIGNFKFDPIQVCSTPLVLSV